MKLILLTDRIIIMKDFGFGPTLVNILGTLKRYNNIQQKWKHW